MNTKFIGIDLGTSNTLIYLEDHGIIFNEPTVVSFNKETRHVVDIGYLAAKVIGRAPYNIDVIRPMKSGVVADVEATVDFITRVFEILKFKKILKGSTILMLSPSDVTKVGREALISVAQKLGARKIIIETQSRMAAIGTGVDILSPRGNMIVDLGGGTTDIAVITLGEIVLARSTEISSDQLDRAIVRFMRNVHHLVIGEKTAEFIKMKIGSVENNPDNYLLDVNGRNIVSGLPHSVIISTNEIKAVLLPLMTRISEIIIDALEITPPELSADIVHNGIVLSGGGAMLAGTREFFEKTLNVPVRISATPLNTVIDGIVEFVGK